MARVFSTLCSSKNWRGTLPGLARTFESICSHPYRSSYGKMGNSSRGMASEVEVVIVGAARTPFGGFQGGLSSMGACKLGSIAIIGALQKARVKAEAVQEVILGNVLSAGLGQAPAKQAALGAGLPPSTICTTVNKVCSSGMKAIMLGAQSIALGINDVVVAGGMESMSNAPFLIQRGLSSRKVGPLSLQDSLEWDGLWDPHKHRHMGNIADSSAKEMSISRDDQDDYAIESYQRAVNAQMTGVLATEIVPVEISGKKGRQSTVVTLDEGCSTFDPEKLRNLVPAFDAGGTITAANSSSISDGAVAMVLTSSQYAQQNGLTVLASIRGYADAEQAPEKFPTSPAKAIPRALARAGLDLKDVSIFEINEAFSVVALANNRLLGLDGEDVNLNGGAVSLGHPIGASGARIVLSLITALAIKGKNIGVAAVCNGGGGASAIVLERCSSYRLEQLGHHSWGVVQAVQRKEVEDGEKVLKTDGGTEGQ